MNIVGLIPGHGSPGAASAGCRILYETKAGLCHTFTFIEAVRLLSLQPGIQIQLRATLLYGVVPEP